MNIDEMAKGAAIELEVKYNFKTMNFQSEIAHIISNSILIPSIKVENQTVGFSEKCSVNLLYKVDGKLFIWGNVKVNLIKYDGEIYNRIDIIGEGKAHNRREAYRMYLGEDMPIRINTAEGPSAISVLIKDISETGVGFITKEELDVSRTFRLRLKDNNATISLSGIIVRKETLNHLSSNIYGCKFNEQNNTLTKFIAKKQGELLKSKSKFNAAPSSRKLVLK